MLAGAKTLVMSLWKVPDDQTREDGELLQSPPGRRRSGQALRKRNWRDGGSTPTPSARGAFICQGAPGPLVLPPVRPRRQTVGPRV